MKSKFAFAFLTVALALTFASSGRASTIIYSNIEPGDTFGPGIAIGIIPFVGIYNLAGIGFDTGGADYTLDSLELAVSLSTGPNVLDVYLMGTAAGLPSGVLESFALDNEMSTDPSTGMVTIDSLTHPLLQAGMEYWIVAGGGPATTAFWAENTHGVEGPNVSGGSLTTLQRDSNRNTVEVLEVEGTLAGVPEPATWMLMLSGLVFTSRRLHCKRLRPASNCPPAASRLRSTVP